jgi:hypothetical protein
MPEQWREVAQEPEMGDGAGMKVSKQRQNMPCFDSDQPGLHF